MPRNGGVVSGVVICPARLSCQQRFKKTSFFLHDTLKPHRRDRLTASQCMLSLNGSEFSIRKMQPVNSGEKCASGRCWFAAAQQTATSGPSPLEPPPLRTRDEKVAKHLNAGDVFHLLRINDVAVELRHDGLRQQLHQTAARI